MLTGGRLLAHSLPGSSDSVSLLVECTTLAVGVVAVTMSEPSEPPAAHVIARARVLQGVNLKSKTPDAYA